jgi:hypothetical protein
MKNQLSFSIFILFLSFVSCSNIEAGGSSASRNESVQDTNLSLFKATLVDTIKSPSSGITLYSYSATHIDSTYFINFHKATEKEREEYYGPISPSEPNSKDIQFFQFKDAASGANWTKINDTLRYLVMGNSSPEKALMYKDSDFIMSIYTESVSMDLLEWTKDYISISQNTGGYYGGAHGLYGSTYYTFDIKSGERLSYADLVSNESLPKLSALVQQNYEKLFGKAYLEFSDKFELPNSFAFTKEGLKFLYNPYEMGSYVDGLREVTVSYSALKGIIKTAYK